MKNPFQAPEMEIVSFDVKDIITVSFPLLGGMEEGGDGGAEDGGVTNW